MDDLFARGGLQQETGVLPPNYLQDGNDYIVLTVPNINDEVVLTVTTNKKFYLMGMIIQEAGGDSFGLYDGTSVADPLAVAGTFGVGTHNFNTPVVFETSIFCNCTNEIQFATFFGWEQ